MIFVFGLSFGAPLTPNQQLPEAVRTYGSNKYPAACEAHPQLTADYSRGDTYSISQRTVQYTTVRTSHQPDITVLADWAKNTELFTYVRHCPRDPPRQSVTHSLSPPINRISSPPQALTPSRTCKPVTSDTLGRVPVSEPVLRSTASAKTLYRRGKALPSVGGRPGVHRGLKACFLEPPGTSATRDTLYTIHYVCQWSDPGPLCARGETGVRGVGRWGGGGVPQLMPAPCHSVRPEALQLKVMNDII